MIDKENLAIGAIYEVAALKFNVAVWTGEVFRGPTIEYGNLTFKEERGYWEPLPYGTCKPLRLLSDYILAPPFDGVNLLKAMYTLDSVMGQVL